MDPTHSSTSEKEVLSQAEVDQLLEQVATQEGSAPLQAGDGASTAPLPTEQIQRHDFRSAVFVSTNELRKLRVEHEAFVQALSARLSIFLRLEFGLEMSQLKTVTYRNFVSGLANPCHLALFKIEPLRGICILELNPRLGLAIIDRLMGGAGQPAAGNRDLSEIEVALLDQAVQMIIAEWCHHWAKFQELHPVMLGHESSGRFLHTSQPDAVMLALSMSARMGDCVESIQIGFPYPTLEPLVRALNLKIGANEEVAAAKPEKPKWKRDFDEIKIPVVADWSGITVTARQLAQLQVGDILPLPAEFSTGVRLCLAKAPKFAGRLGTRDQHWAIELTEALTP